MQWPLKAEPKAVQVEAFKRSHDREKYGLWMEQGLGKTASCFADFIYWLRMGKCSNLCVIPPNYLKSGWEDEALLYEINMPIYFWPQVQRERKLKEPHVLVINCESLLYSGGDWLEDRLKRGNYMMAVDESSIIKNHQGATTKKINTILAPYCPIRRALSGTPMPNNVMDLWSQLRFLGELNGVNPYAFRNKYAVMGGWMGKQVKGVKNEDQLQKLLSGVVFRALKKDWWEDCPEKIYLPPLEFEMTAAQKKAYKTMLDEFYAMVNDREEDAVFADQVINMQQKLQQISRGFLLDGDKVHELVPLKDNPAVKVTKQFLDATPGKHIVFTLHRHSTDMLEEALKEFNPAVLRGGMSQAEIAEAKRRFNNDPECRDIVGQLSVAHRGHTLLGTADMRCSTSLFFENWYSLEVRKQAEDRNHRWGQDRAVVYADLYGAPQDKRPIIALQKKQDLVTAVLDSIRALRQ